FFGGPIGSAGTTGGTHVGRSPSNDGCRTAGQGGVPVADGGAVPGRPAGGRQRRAAAGAVRRRGRGGGGGRVPGAGGAARADGPGRLPPGPRRSSRGGGRRPGDL